jgi:hypothetical protein
MPDNVEVEGQQLVLNGLGLREATIAHVDVYVAGLYLPTQTSNAVRILQTDQTWQLVLHFVRGVDADKITEAWYDGFSGALTQREMIQVSEEITTLNGWMEDMEDGDEMVFTYMPDQGLRVTVKGNTKGQLGDADFASAFLSIWLGPHPPNDGLKRGLLGGECD